MDYDFRGVRLLSEAYGIQLNKFLVETVGAIWAANKYYALL